MIGYVRGKVVQLVPDCCLIEVQGIGYRVFIPASTREELTVGREAVLYTYLHVREDALLLYGFGTQEEHDLFLKLVSVSGIGPKVGIGILSAIKPAAFVQAISNKDLSVLTSISGIGKKTAERIVLELKDKIGSFAANNEADITISQGDESLQQQAIEALLALGYNQAEVMPIIRRLEHKSSVEEIIKSVLKEFGGRK